MFADPWIGRTLLGYRIETVLGRGGMGVVYRAEHLSLGRKVALKVLSPALAGNADFRRRFVQESRVASSIQHPSIIPIHEAGEAEDVLFIAMRYVEGADLGRLLERQAPLDPRRTVGLLAQIAGALDAAHARGLVHRDVKPGNVLISAEVGPDGYEHCYLCDFGLIKPFDTPSDVTVSGQFIGTVPYMPPEQIRGEPLDGRTDVYALACVAFRCLTGRLPFDRGSDVANVEAHLHEPPPRASLLHAPLPPALDPILARAMAKAKEQRQPSCSALIADIRGAVEPAAIAPAVAWLDPEPTRPMALGAVPAGLLQSGGASGGAQGTIAPAGSRERLGSRAPADAQAGPRARGQGRSSPLADPEPRSPSGSRGPWPPSPGQWPPGDPGAWAPAAPPRTPPASGDRPTAPIGPGPRRDTPGLIGTPPPAGRWAPALERLGVPPPVLLLGVLALVAMLAFVLVQTVGGGRRPAGGGPGAGRDPGAGTRPATGTDLAAGGSTTGQAAASCVNGWTAPRRGSALRRQPFETMRAHLGVRGLYTISQMRYFTARDGTGHWYVETTRLGGRPWHARWLVERPPGAERPLVAAVAPAASSGLRSPDWRAFRGDGPPRRYAGLPGRYRGTPYDYVTGADGHPPGLPDDVRGCLAGS